MSQPPITHSRRAQRAIRRVESALAAELEPGESLEAAVFAQRWLPFLELVTLFGAIGDAIFVIVARPYYLAATRSRFFMLRAGRLWPSAGERVFEASLDAVRIEPLRMRGPLRRQIRLQQLGGSDYRLSIHRAYWRELERLQSLAGATAS